MKKNLLPSFDENGNLPPGCYECCIDEIKQRFVDDFSESSSRSSRFEGFVKYSRYICESVKSTRKQLINGSFTTKKLNPHDVDVVIVLNQCDMTLEESKFIEKEKIEEKERKKFYQSMKKFVKEGFVDINDLYCCDCYFLHKREPNEGKLYKDYLKDKNYWLKWWRHTRKNKKTHKKNPKGIIDLKMNSKTFEGIE